MNIFASMDLPYEKHGTCQRSKIKRTQNNQKFQSMICHVCSICFNVFNHVLYAHIIIGQVYRRYVM